MYYNKTMFDKSGLPYPTPKWTWEDFKTAAKLLTKDANNDGVVEQYGAICPSFESVIWSFGGDILDNPFNPTKCIVNNPNTVRALNFLAQLFQEKIVVPPGVYREQVPYEMFSTGRLGMFFDGRWRVPDFVKIKEFYWDVVNVPGGIAQHGGTAYAISADTKHPEEAWQFVKFYTSHEGIKIAIESGRTTPIYKSIATSQFFVGRKPPENMSAFVKTMETARQVSYIPENAQIMDVITKYWDIIIYKSTEKGDVNINKICQDMKKEIEFILNKRIK